mgnify:CR=1 FL=1
MHNMITKEPTCVIRDPRRNPPGLDGALDRRRRISCKIGIRPIRLNRRPVVTKVDRNVLDIQTGRDPQPK